MTDIAHARRGIRGDETAAHVAVQQVSAGLQHLLDRRYQRVSGLAKLHAQLIHMRDAPAHLFHQCAIRADVAADLGVPFRKRGQKRKGGDELVDFAGETFHLVHLFLRLAVVLLVPGIGEVQHGLSEHPRGALILDGEVHFGNKYL